MPDAKYAETRRMAEVALRESAGVDLVADWQAAALSVCRTVLEASHLADRMRDFADATHALRLATNGEAFEALSALVNSLRARHYGRMPDEVQAAYEKAAGLVFATPHVAETPKQEHEAGDVSPGVTGAGPVAVLRFERGTPGRENEMPRVVSCDWLPDGEYHVYLATQPAAQQGEPFGYFRAEPFGWTDCAEGDEGAVALYEKAGVTDATMHKIIAGVEAALDAAGAPAGTLVERIAALAEDAARWRFSVADGGNQRMRWLDVYDDWDGDGDFTAAIDAARTQQEER